MSKQVIYGCKLPHGITLKGPQDEDITINGLNTSLVQGGYGLTTVDASLSAFLQMTYNAEGKELAPFKNNAIFFHTDLASVVDLGKELQDEKTGLEGLNPDAPAPGLKPDEATEKALKMAVAANSQPGARPVKGVKGKQDQAATLQLAAAIGNS